MSRGEKTKELWKDPVYREHMKEVHMGISVNRGLHWKIKDTSKMHHSAWNKNIKGVKHSEEHKRKIGSSVSGEKNYRWIEDRSLLKDDHKDRGGQLHREWSKQVKSRDGWKCKIDNDDCSGSVVAHHILSWRDYPELHYQTNNGITLCHAHHPRKREEEAKLSPFFQNLVAEMK